VYWFSLVPPLRIRECAIWTTVGRLGLLALQQVLVTMSQASRHFALFRLLAVSECTYPRALWWVNFRPLLERRVFLLLSPARTMPPRLSFGFIVRVAINTKQCRDAAIPFTHLSPDVWSELFWSDVVRANL
jgi:hypothetical protein